jgi:hypothetical protein
MILSTQTPDVNHNAQLCGLAIDDRPLCPACAAAPPLTPTPSLGQAALDRWREHVGGTGYPEPLDRCDLAAQLLNLAATWKRYPDTARLARAILLDLLTESITDIALAVSREVVR